MLERGSEQLAGRRVEHLGHRVIVRLHVRGGVRQIIRQVRLLFFQLTG